MHPAALVALAAPPALIVGFRRLRHRQLLADTPTSQCIGVFLGWNEVKGTAWHATPTMSHFANLACVRWSARVLEEVRVTRTVTSTDANGHTTTSRQTSYEWREIAAWNGDVGPFFVVDHSGNVLVDPRAATVHDRVVVDRIRGERAGGWFAGDGPTGRTREVEQVIAVGDRLYVTGGARLRDDAVAPVIDSADDGPFLVSTRDEDRVRRGFGWWGGGLLVLGLTTATIGSGFAFGAPTSGEPSHLALPWLPGLVVALLMLGTGGLVLLYNGLVRVANRAERAWSLIEVMLQRRHDLVPRILAVVTAGRDHEADLHTRAAHLRTPQGSSAGTAGALAAEQTEVLRSVLARAEAYPELRTDESFRALHDQLADTENRIEAARAFHNDSVTALRDRTGTFPGLLVARFGDFAGRELFAAEGFERAVPTATV